MAIAKVFDQGNLTDGDAGYVGDCVERTWLAFERDAGIPGARIVRGRGAGRREKENESGEKPVQGFAALDSLGPTRGAWRKWERVR